MFVDPTKNKVKLGQQFVQVIKEDANGVPIEEAVYYLSDNAVTVDVFKRLLTAKADTVYIRSDFMRDPVSRKSFLMTEYLYTNPSTSATTRSVELKELNGQQALFNANNNGSFTAEIVDGKIKLCDVGCSDCQCTGCLNGFAHDSNLGICTICAPGCKVCAANDQTTCTTCADGSFKNSSNMCEPCAPGC